MSRKTMLIAAIWLAVFATGLGAGAWVSDRREAAEREEGLRAAREAAVLVRRARGLGAEADARTLVLLYEQAACTLRRADGPGRRAALAGVLLDLSSAQLAVKQEDANLRAAAERNLVEAWSLGGLSAGLRSRVARDRGALRTLAGDLPGAEAWYAEALRLCPSDERATDRLSLLRSTKAPPFAPPP